MRQSVVPELNSFHKSLSPPNFLIYSLMIKMTVRLLIPSKPDSCDEKRHSCHGVSFYRVDLTELDYRRTDDELTNPLITTLRL